MTQNNIRSVFKLAVKRVNLIFVNSDQQIASKLRQGGPFTKVLGLVSNKKAVKEEYASEQFTFRAIERVKCLNGVRVNQRIRFPPNVNDFPLFAPPSPACWLYASGGKRNVTGSVYVYLPRPV